MVLNTLSDSVTAAALSQAAIDALYPSGGVRTQWKLSRPGRILLQGIHPLQGPQLAGDGTVLQASQTVWAMSDFPGQYAAGLVIAGP